VLTALLVGLAVPLVDLMGGEGRTGDLAVLYLRIGSLGLPFALIALSGSLALELGIVGVWVGLLGLIAVRLATCGWRFRGRRWAIVGAQRAPA
jgi:MATE family, multidrug efflux pump